MARMYIHVRRRGRMRQAGQEQEDRLECEREDETSVRWMATERDDTAGCCQWLHQAPPQRSTRSTAPHRPQRRQTGSIFLSEMAGWLVLDDDIRTHSHDRVHCAEQTASLAPKARNLLSTEPCEETGKASLACSLSCVRETRRTYIQTVHMQTPLTTHLLPASTYSPRSRVSAYIRTYSTRI
jgi:hypothetical protein